MSIEFNYRHLYYFWRVAHEGSMARAAARLGIAVQTISTQVRLLEVALGCTLLRPAGRGLALTEAGLEALRQADAIFRLGEQLPVTVRGAAVASRARFAVGLSDALPKLAVHRLLSFATTESSIRLRIDEGEFDDLLAELALHRLDVVIADRPAPQRRGLRLYSHLLGRWPVAWYAPPALIDRASLPFPGALAHVPVLLPTAHSALRAGVDQWFAQHDIRPDVAGEFEDSALLATFAAAGLGILPAPALAAPELEGRYGLRRVGPCDGVEVAFHAIGTERKVLHPMVQRLLSDPA